MHLQRRQSKLLYVRTCCYCYCCYLLKVYDCRHFNGALRVDIKDATVATAASGAVCCCRRYPRLDDQAIFWRVIRTSSDPPVLPIGKCRHFNTANDLASMYHYRSQRQYLVSCMLDTCVFSSGMISRVYEPELTYGACEKLLFCCC